MNDLELGPAPAWRLTPAQLIAIDASAASIYLIVTLAGALPEGSSATVPTWMHLLIAAGVGLPVAVRRRWPQAAMSVTLPFSVAAVLLGVIADPFLAAAGTLYMVALTRYPRHRLPTLTIGVTGVLIVVAMAIGGPVGWRPGSGGLIVIGAALLGVSWALGSIVRERREHAANEARRLAREAVTEERLLIARELHDVVAHSMSVVTVKAGIANHVIDERPDEAAEALRVIESTGRSALNEMRHLLGVLRSEDGATAGDLGPSPDLADIPAVADRARDAGIDVDLRVEFDETLPEGIEISIYRIVQEALTNVIKHAPGARCRVRVAEEGSAVTVAVSDDGSRQPERATKRGHVGHGLVGMRERVALYGGRLTAQPRSGGGFCVHATIPYVTTKNLTETP